MNFMLHNLFSNNNLFGMAKKKTKEILEYYIKKINISITAESLKLARKTVSMTFDAADAAWKMIRKIWDLDDLGENVDYAETQNETLKSYLLEVKKLNPMEDKNEEKIRSFFIEEMQKTDNEEINRLLFQIEEKNKNEEELNMVASYLEEKGTTITDSYQWAKDNGLKIANFTKPYFEKLFRDFRASNGLSNRIKFKPGEIMEIKWYRLETNEKNKNGNAYPMTSDKYYQIQEEEKKRENKGRWLFVTYLPFSRRVSFNVYKNINIDNMVNAIIKDMKEVGAPERIISNTLKKKLIEKTRKWSVFSFFLNVYGIIYTKDERACAFEKTEGKLISDIKEFLKKKNWYKNINTKVLSLEKMHNLNMADIDKEKEYLRKIDITDEKKMMIRLFKVQSDSHIRYNYKRYSCPYQYVGDSVIVYRMVDKIILYDKDMKGPICKHDLITSERIKYSTDGSHMPKNDTERLSVGMNTRDSLLLDVESDDIKWMINKYLDYLPYEEQGYETIRYILYVFHRYFREPLESFSQKERMAWNNREGEGLSSEELKNLFFKDFLEFKSNKITKNSRYMSKSIYLDITEEEKKDISLNMKDDEYEKSDVVFQPKGAKSLDEIDSSDVD